MELVAVAASETENPRRNIAKAVRRVFYRILVFYILGVLITGMLIPYDDPNLLQCKYSLAFDHTTGYVTNKRGPATGTAAQSPYVIAMTRAGIKVLPSIINAAIFTSALSAGNSYLFSGSRVLYGLALRKQAPQYLTYCTKKGLPIAAVGTVSLIAWLAFMNVSEGAATVFK
jgi:amino acid transporter